MWDVAKPNNKKGEKGANGNNARTQIGKKSGNITIPSPTVSNHHPAEASRLKHVESLVFPTPTVSELKHERLLHSSHNTETLQ